MPCPICRAPDDLPPSERSVAPNRELPQPRSGSNNGQAPSRRDLDACAGTSRTRPDDPREGRGTPSEPPMDAQRADSSTARCAMLAKRERWVDRITTERPAASAMANSACWMNLAPQRFGVGQVPMSFGPVPRATRDVQPRAAGFWQRQSLPLIAPAPLCLRSSLWSARARECACASLKVAVIARTWRAGLSENRRPIFVPQTRAALFRKTI